MHRARTQVGNDARKCTIAGGPEEDEMTNVDGIQPVSAARPIQPTQAPIAPQDNAAPGWISDVAEISTASILAARIHEIPDVRTDLVQRVKQQIEAGTYETEERIDVTVDRLMDELFPQ